MAFWSHQTWQSRGKDEEVITPWNESRVKEADYSLSVGKEYFTNSDDGSSAIGLQPNEGFSIAPGQFVFILTEEKIKIPKNTIGLISARASTKFRGLVNVSGFQVNPGFDGNFIFAMFNAGPNQIHLRRGDEVFSIWICDLDDEFDLSKKLDGKIPNEIDSIPSDILNGISGKALTAYQVKELLEKQNGKIAKLDTQLSAIKDRFTYLATVGAVILVIVLLLFGPELRNKLGFAPKSKPPNSSMQSG